LILWENLPNRRSFQYMLQMLHMIT